MSENTGRTHRGGHRSDQADRRAPPAPGDPERPFIVLRSAQRALLRAEDEARLLDTICRIAVNEAGYRLAWVGFAEDDPERTVRPVAHAGHEAGYLDSSGISWADTRLGMGPTGRAIRSGLPVMARSSGADPDLAPWREQAIRDGFASCLALPLRAGDGPFGALTICATEPDAFTPEDVEMLAGLADDLAFGITMLRERATRHAAVEGLRLSERNLAQAQRIAQIGSWEWTAATDALEVSDEMCRILGVAPGTLGGTNDDFMAFVHPDDRVATREAERAALEDGTPYNLDYRIVRTDGAVRTIHEVAEVIRDDAGRPVSMVGIAQDITDRIAADSERARLASAVEQTGDSVWMQDLNNIVTYVNRSFTRVYGWQPDEIVGRHAGIVDSGHYDPAFFTELWASVRAGRTWAGSIVNLRRDGSTVEVDAVISGIRGPDGRVVSYLQTDRDVTHLRALEGALQRAARERETIEAALVQIDPTDPPEAIAAAACAEIVRLPEIESAWAIGLDDGRGVVLAAAGRLGGTLTVGSHIPAAPTRRLRERAATGPWTETWQARPGDGAYGEAMTTSDLHTAGYAPLAGPHRVVGVIGFGVHDGTSADRVIEGLPALATFGAIVGSLVAPGLTTRHHEDAARASVQAILDEAAFSPFFQPIVEFRSGAVVGYEALTRFGNGRPPDAVFSLALRAGLGLQLETATLRAALEAAAVLPARAYLSLNVSPALIESGALGEFLHGCERSIVLEITEHVVIDDYSAVRDVLAGLGPTCRLAVDDAGAGYASLRHILELAPDFVKLDIGLTRGIDADPARQALIAGMGYFATKRRMHIIAEGIETRQELAALRALAVPYGQGYLLGRPQDGRKPGAWPTRIAVAGL